MQATIGRILDKRHRIEDVAGINKGLPVMQPGCLRLSWPMDHAREWRQHQYPLRPEQFYQERRAHHGVLPQAKAFAPVNVSANPSKIDGAFS